MPDSGTDGEPQVEIADDRPRRVRRSLDLVRLAGLLLVIVLAGGIGTVANDTAHSANDDLSRLFNEIPHLLVRGLSLLGTLGALALPIALGIREIVRGHPRRLIEGLATGLLAIVVVQIIGRAISADSSSALHASLTQLAHGATLRPLDAYLAALFALALVLGVAGDGWRAAFWVVATVYIASAFIASQASLLALLASPTIGAAVGLAVRYVAGTVNERPDMARVLAELRPRGFDFVRIERVRGTGDSHRDYLATTRTGEHLNVLVFDRDLIASGAVYGIYRRLRLRAVVATSPALSLERTTERRASLAMTAAAADVRIPRFVAGEAVGPDTIVLVYERIAGSELKDPTDAQLADLWSNVVRLHYVGMTHRGLAAGRILLDDDGRVVLPVPTDGALFATELRVALDRAQVLITTAQLAGAARAVAVARTVLTDEELAATMPLLQPIALSRATRAAIRKDSELLESVASAIQGQTHQRPPEPVKVERIRPRVVLSIVAVIVAGYLLVGQLGSVDLVTVFDAARWRWVPLVIMASAATYFAAALSLIGFVREKLSFLRTTLVQLAASFVGFVAPPSVGGLAINVRYLRVAKVSATGAATSVGVSQAVNAVVHALLLILLAAATGVSSRHSLPIPGWAFVVLGAAAVLALLILAVPGPRHWILARAVPAFREAVPRLLSLLSSPTKLTEALSGTLLLNVFYVAALWFAVQAFGGGVGLAGVAVVYLAGAAVASVAPTPGGLGAVEVALSTGLAAASMPTAAAVSAVLLFRIGTFWLPVPAGWVALHFLQRRGAL